MKLKLLGTGIAVLSLLAATFSAEAADIPRPVYKGVRSVIAYYNWTGFYAGISGGYAMAKADWSSPSGSATMRGWNLGGTLGYNFQAGAFVWGIEGDASRDYAKGDFSCGAGVCTTERSYLATLRGRVGYATDRFLPYFTGGAAYGDVKATNSNAGFGTATAQRLGWTAGAGLEYAFLGNWTAKLEYLYIDFGSFDCGTACSATPPANVRVKENLFRVGINYKFSGPIFSRF